MFCVLCNAVAGDEIESFAAQISSRGEESSALKDHLRRLQGELSSAAKQVRPFLRTPVLRDMKLLLSVGEACKDSKISLGFLERPELG